MDPFGLEEYSGKVETVTSITNMIHLYFSDFFGVHHDAIVEYGAFDISLVNDLPLFVDPFLLFNSEKEEYRRLHREILKYVGFLRDKSGKKPSESQLRSWYMFPEVKEVWFGYSKVGNRGSGLGKSFASSLYSNLHTIFSNFGNEDVTSSGHIEKVCLVRDGVGRDNISDFTCNLIKDFLLKYTQDFAVENIDESLRRKIKVPKCCFNYETETWVSKEYDLPYFRKEFVLLTPVDILTKDDTWINKNDIVGDFDSIVDSISNQEIRFQIGNYFSKALPKTKENKTPTKKERSEAVSAVVQHFPSFLDYYILHKEKNGDKAANISKQKVDNTMQLFVTQLSFFAESLLKGTQFYSRSGDTYEETRERIEFLKQVIENNDGYRLFYVNGEPVKKEEDLQLLFRLTWRATPSDVNSEVNNGRGPVDYKVSRGSTDKTLVEFKLASNSQLKKNLLNQVKVYEKANQTKKSFKVIIYFTERELQKVENILKGLKLEENTDIILIDARDDNKPSGSKA